MQIKSIDGIFQKDHESDEIKDQLHKNKSYENKVIRDNLFYQSCKQVYDFKLFISIRSVSESIYNYKIKIVDVKQGQADLMEYASSFTNKAKPRSDEDKNKKKRK